jgi:hypothetical protein
VLEKFGWIEPENQTLDSKKTLAFVILNDQRLMGKVVVQDTDFAYRPRVSYDEHQAHGHGR